MTRACVKNARPWVWKRGRFPRARWPKHASKHLRRRLRAEANGLRGLYGASVYLVGSALLDCNERPRDWDIRITISDEQFQRRYGSPERWQFEGGDGQWTSVRWRWSDDCVKQSRQCSINTGLLVDVQVYPISYEGRFTGKPRLRLDTRRNP
jgi:hypothetical protein